MLSLYHPHLDVTISVHELSAYLYRESGWVDAEEDGLPEDNTILEQDIKFEDAEDEFEIEEE